MLYSTDMEHSQTMDRHKITCTVFIHPDPDNPMTADRRIKVISDATYLRQRCPGSHHGRAQAGLPVPVDPLRSGGRISMNIANAIRSSVADKMQKQTTWTALQTLDGSLLVIPQIIKELKDPHETLWSEHA